MTRSSKIQKVYDMYGSEYPSYLKIKNLSKISIKTGEDWQGGPTWHDITVQDVVRFYAMYCNDFQCSVRKLSDIVGDHRPMGYLAEECLEIFKVLNINKLRSETKNYSGLQCKF